MNSSDGDGISWRDLQMQRLNAQAVAEQMAKVSEDAEKQKPQCPFCGGRLPGKFELCVHCNRQLYWGHDATLVAFKTSEEAQRNVREVSNHLKEIAAAKTREREEIRAMCSRHGIIVGLPWLGVLLTLCGLGFAAYYGQENAYVADAVRSARLGQAWAVACCGLASLVGVTFPRYAMVLVFPIGAVCMGFLGMPLWICSIPTVIGLSELFPMAGAEPLESTPRADKGEWEKKYSMAIEAQQSRSHVPKQTPAKHQPDSNPLRGTSSTTTPRRLPSLTCPRCKGDIPMPSLTALNITCPTCGGVFKTKRQKSAEA